MSSVTEHHHLLHLCRAAMPGVSGVVLSTMNGTVLAHEEALVADPARLAAEAVTTHAIGVQTGTLVPHDGGLYLVVFLPPA